MLVLDSPLFVVDNTADDATVVITAVAALVVITAAVAAAVVSLDTAGDGPTSNPLHLHPLRLLKLSLQLLLKDTFQNYMNLKNHLNQLPKT